MRILHLAPKSALLIFAVLAASRLSAQEQHITTRSSTAKPVVKKPKPTSKEFSVAAKLTSDGYGVYANKSFVKSDNPKQQDMFYNARMYQVSLEEHKNAKEIKQALQDASGAKTKPFIFGKTENFYALKLGYGFRKLIAGKPEAGTVSIHWTGVGGVAIGLEKPYYIDADAPEDNGSGPLVRKSIKYSDETKEYFLSSGNIYGSSGFAKGIGEIKINPGLQASTGLHFDFAPNKRHVLAIETGISAEYYSRPVLLLADQKSQSLFVNLYAAFEFGWRK